MVGRDTDSLSPPMSSRSQMDHPLSGHLSGAIILIAAAIVAAAASRAAAPMTSPAPRPGSSASGEMTQFVTRPARAPVSPDFTASLDADPLVETSGESNVAVAQGAAAPTVSPSAGAQRLTAVLIADERRVAVIDDAAVSIGDVLRDGSRVSAIQPDRVWIIEKNGHWRALTLARVR